MTHVGKCVSAKGVQPIATYQHKFENTYLFGSYSPIDGDQFVWEINGIDAKIFEAYLKELSLHRPTEFKIIIIDNASYHTTKKLKVPQNIYLMNIPPYSPELNPCEQVWQYIKQRYKNTIFESMDSLRKWLHKFVVEMTPSSIKSITSNHHYLEAFNATF